MVSEIGEEIYIVSFCGEAKNSYVNSNGLLSQWRGYGVERGIDMAFDTNKPSFFKIIYLHSGIPLKLCDLQKSHIE